MNFDPTASVLENVVVQKELELAGDEGDKFLILIKELFYSKDFRLWKIDPTGAKSILVLATDYRFVYRVPVFRSQDTIHPAFAGIELIEHVNNHRYVADYRCLGATAQLDEAELVRYHQDNSESSGVNFLGLLTQSGSVPDEPRLKNAQLNLTPVLISFSSRAGLAELAARELGFEDTEVTTPTTGEVTDASETTKGIVKLAGDLEGTADNPRVKGLSSFITAAQAQQLFLSKEQADEQYATIAQGQKADDALSATEAAQNFYSKTAADSRFVRSVNKQPPDSTGDVTLSGGGGGTGSGGGSIDGGIF